MKKLFLSILCLLILSVVANAAGTEKYKYVVTYKWGLIQKDAGDVVITHVPKGDGYELKLTAKTKPWADKVYKVRDTLISVTSREKYRPIRFSHIAHEKNKYRHDEIKFSYSGNKVYGRSEKYKEDKNGKITSSVHQLEGAIPTYDMLSVYFFLRDLDYSKMKAGETINATIFSGSKSENLQVRCKGKETIKLRDNTEREAWHIVFKFTQHGGKKSSDDISCWISTAAPHIPLQIVGSLPIGQIKVHYVGS